MSTVLVLFACLAACTDPGDDDDGLPFTAMTFNTGTAGNIQVEPEENFGYGPEQEMLADEYYGNGLAWKAAVEAARQFILDLSPDIVSFQEIFHSPECSDIPAEARAGFVCEDWEPGDPAVAEMVLGEGYQIATHWGRPDKVLAVHERFGRIEGCHQNFCIDGLEGYPEHEDCGRGGRVGRARVERGNGETITVVSYHGRSGFAQRDIECRVGQVEQIFVDFGDGQPAANGTANLILGDFNTDPGRLESVDRSAERWNDFVGPEKAFHFISEVGPEAPESYMWFDIDHIVSDVFHGYATYHGLTEGTEPVFAGQLFDHIPVVARIDSTR